MSPYLNLSFFLTVLISKEFLIFNEEILVLLAFALFTRLVVILIGEASADELIMRGNKIRGDFNFYKNLQMKSLSYLLNYNDKQKNLSIELKKNASFSKFDISILAHSYPKNFQNSILAMGSACLKQNINRGSVASDLGQSRLFKVFYKIDF
jgi:hypothetical protein